LLIDDQQVGVFDSGTLASGINLAALPTPMVEQAARVHALTLEHNNLHFKRWRNVQVPLADLEAPSVKTSLQHLITALDEEESRIVARQRKAAKPIARRFELKAQ
jgi:hypothetical protein